MLYPERVYDNQFLFIPYLKRVIVLGTMRHFQYRLAAFLLICILTLPLAMGQRIRKHKPMKRRHRPSNYVNSLTGTVGTGMGTYYGDLCDSWDCFKFRHHLEIGAQYRLNGSVSFRTEVTWARLFGTDKGGINENRNLHFRGDNFELSAVVVYDIFEFYRMHLKRYKYAPYLFLGMGLTNVNPKAEYENKWYGLRKLSTEGQTYSAFTFSIPYGGGVRYLATPHLSLSFEVGYRWTFTDYLDDVSTTYVDNSSLTGIAAILADRTSEGGYTTWDSNDGEHWAAGHIRGNPSKNDGFLLFGVKAEYVLKVTQQHYNINSNHARFRIIKSIKRKR